jgi:hypothetical protein
MTALSPRVGKYNKVLVYLCARATRWIAVIAGTLRFWPNRPTGPRFSFWSTVLIGIAVLKLAFALLLKPESLLVAYGGIPYFALLLVASGFAFRNAIEKTLKSRPFRVFLAIAYGLWALDQSIFLYYQFGPHIDVTRGLSSDFHTLSHELHSSRLEHVRLNAARDGLCKDVSEKHKIEIQFIGCELSRKIPNAVALCLFRIAQEALGHVSEHSGSQSAQVKLDENRNVFTLRISDSGTGFNPPVKSQNAGIGLIGMNERLRIVGGRLLVNSRPNCGTEIFAEVPRVTLEVGTQSRSEVVGRQNVEAHASTGGGRS